MSQPTKLQRHLDLIAYLVGRRLPVTVEELMERIPAYAEKWNAGDQTGQNSARRMFERDKDELRDIGIPLKTVPYSIDYGRTELEGYAIDRRDFYLPYLKLVRTSETQHQYAERGRAAEVDIQEEDAPIALEALRRVSSVPSFPLLNEAKSAFRKLAFDLDPEAFDKQSPVLFADRPQSDDVAAHLRVLSKALLARKRVKFRYHGIYRGEETQRDVDGFGLLFQGGQWYLIGFDRLRDDVRVFRVGRMADVAPNKASPSTPDYEVPADFELGKYAGRQPWELGEAEEQPITARVLFKFPLSLWAERNRYGAAESRHDNGDVVRRFTVHQTNPFLRWLLGMQDETEILEPAELRAELRGMAQKIVAAHTEDTHGGR